MGEERSYNNGEISETSSAKSGWNRKHIAVVVSLIVIIGAVGVALALTFSSEPEQQYEKSFDHDFTYDGPGWYWEDRFFWSSWSAESTHLVSNMGSSRVAFWNLTHGGLSSWKSVDLPVQDPGEGNAFWAVEAHPIRDVVAVGWYQGIAFFDLEGNLLSEIRGGSVHSVAWKHTGGLITASWFDHDSRTSYLRSFNYPSLSNHSSRNLDVRLDVLKWSPNGLLLAGCNRDHGLYVFDVNLLLKLRIEKYTSEFSLSWSPDSSALLVREENELVLLDVDSLEERVRIPRSSEESYCGSEMIHEGGGYAVSGAFSPSGDLIAVGYSNGVIEVWSGDGKKRLDTLLFRPCLNNPPRGIYTVTWSPDGLRVAASGDHGITVWERSK